MQDSRPQRIKRAIHLGEQIRNLEQQLDPLLTDQKERQREINRLDAELNQLWLEVGKLKHASGE